MFGLLAAVLALASAAAVERYLAAKETEAANQRLTNIARRFMEVLSQDLLERRRELTAIARFPLLRSPRVSAPERRNALHALRDSHHEYSWLGFVGSDGIVQVATHEVMEGRAVSGSPWFEAGRSGVHVGLAAAGATREREPLRLIEIAVPVRTDGELHGVLAAFVSEEWVEARRSEFLRAGIRTIGADLALVHRSGRALVGPPGFVPVAWQAPAWLGEAAPTVQIYESSPGDAWFAVAARPPQGSALEGLGLRALVRRPVTQDTDGARNLLLGLGFAGALALMFAAWLVAGRITGPLRGLAATATRIAQGETEAPFPQARGTDEVAQLTRALNALVEQLLEDQRELEAKVAGRTRDLMAANRDLEAFSYSVSHDLRAPLRSIHGFASLLREEGAGQLPPGASGRIDRILQSAELMSERFEGLLSLSRLSREPVGMRDVPLGEIAADIAEDLARSAPERTGTRFEIDRAVRAQGDPRLLRLAIENLLGNAWKYTSKTPEARIEFGRDPGGEYFVRDNGVGFDMAWATGLFSPFQRLHEASAFPGTGVGLASVKRIVERHGGTIRAEATPGRGAAFYFTLGGKEGDSGS